MVSDACHLKGTCGFLVPFFAPPVVFDSCRLRWVFEDCNDGFIVSFDFCLLHSLSIGTHGEKIQEINNEVLVC